MFSLFAHLESESNPFRVLDWEPRNDVIVVLPLIEADRTQGGIIMAETSRERPQKGVVLAVGPGLYDAERLKVLPVEAAPGDLVIYGKFSGSTFGLAENVEVLMMRNVEFLARKSRAAYLDTLIEHLVDEATTRERLVYHLSDARCEFCGQEEGDGHASKHYRFALHFETPAARDLRWERVNIARGQEAARKAEEARLRAEEQAQIAATAAVVEADATLIEEPPSIDVIEEERRKLRERFSADLADDAVPQPAPPLAQPVAVADDDIPW